MFCTNEIIHHGVEKKNASGFCDDAKPAEFAEHTDAAEQPADPVSMLGRVQSKGWLDLLRAL